MTDITLLRVERKAGFAILALNNPPMNVVSAPLTRQFYRVLRELERDESIRCVIITGAGDRAFCAGSDITEIRELLDPGAVLEHKLIFQNKVFEILRSFPKPTIAALNGYTYGGGFEIAICCDLIVAEEHVRLCLPEINLGLFPSSGGTFRLARKIGESRAKELVFFGEPIDAKTALEWGLVNRITAKGESLKMAESIATKLVCRSSMAISKAKELINHSYDLSEAALVSKSLQASDQIFASTNAQEGISAFLEKRQAKFN